MSRYPSQAPVAAPSRTLPWSTRAVILLAFAIQLGAISERMGHPSSRPSDALRLCDGQLLTIWLDEAVADSVPALALSAGSVPAVDGSGQVLEWFAAGAATEALAQLSSSVLPIPPPALG